jgi:bifunctional aspartokinase / homoserine dehydrogenase 1
MDCTSPSTLIGSAWGIPSIPSLSLDGVASTDLDHRTGKRNIYKFGGTSVGSPPRLCGLVRIIREERNRVHAVVVSAMGDTTDYLLDAVDAAARGDDQAALKVVDGLVALSIENAHETQRLVQQETGATGEVEDLTSLIVDFFKPLRELLFGICLLQEKTLAALDTVLSFGERMSAQIVAVRAALYWYFPTPWFSRVLADAVAALDECWSRRRLRGCA